jgi:hypothetical protein
VAVMACVRYLKDTVKKQAGLWRAWLLAFLWNRGGRQHRAPHWATFATGPAWPVAPAFGSAAHKALATPILQFSVPSPYWTDGVTQRPGLTQATVSKSGPLLSGSRHAALRDSALSPHPRQAQPAGPSGEGQTRPSSPAEQPPRAREPRHVMSPARAGCVPASRLPGHGVGPISLPLHQAALLGLTAFQAPQAARDLTGASL